jgi:hypothetical protein
MRQVWRRKRTEASPGIPNTAASSSSVYVDDGRTIRITNGHAVGTEGKKASQACWEACAA